MAAAVETTTTSASQTSGSSGSKRKHRHKHDKSNMRTIGRWYIGETLGKGGYSWVKKGYDKKTGKCVALKFMTKADESWVAEQSKQVVTEIESLKQIRHHNVMKLYAYNLNARYPSKDEKTGKETTLDTILLVLEYAPGGELFDILYYTSALEEIVARTYFRQIIAGLEACHNAGVAHRDLKPQNLLLDSRFNIKITDFGLSKLFESDADAQMKTTYVGTRGYQAPELLLDKTYDLSCDVFSIGVVLFILMTGYPPFEQATASDRWYKSMTKKPPNYEQFWKAHRASPLAHNQECKELIQSMLAFDPKDRISIADIKKHPWYTGKYLEGKDLIRALRNRHREMESKRKKDSRKQQDLQTSVKKDIDFRGAELPPILPNDMDEDVGFLHTFEDWQDVYNTIETYLGAVGGQAIYDHTLQLLNCRMAMAKKDSLESEECEFTIQIYISTKYNTDKVFDTLEEIRKTALERKDNTFNNPAGADNNTVEQTSKEEYEEARKAVRKDTVCVYAVRIKRTTGDEMKFARKIKQGFLMVQLGELFTGVPRKRLRALGLLNNSKTNNNNNTTSTTVNTENDEKEESGSGDVQDYDDIVFDDEESDGDYDNILETEGLGLDELLDAAGVVIDNAAGAPSNAIAAAVAAGGDDVKADE